MTILGIDPGSRHTGYGVVTVDGRDERLVEYGVLHLDTKDDHQDRLKAIYDRLSSVIERCRPEVAAIEMPVYGHNPQSMLKLGRAQAAAMLAVLNHGLTVAQYTPKEIKKAVTGNGNASKEQVWYMVRSLLEVDPAGPPLDLDASDALAIALCHAHRLAHTPGPRFKDWSTYVASNPERVRR